jgi:hypothetical protein
MSRKSLAIAGAKVLRAAAVAVLGFFLMFVGHLLAFVGWTATQDLSLHPPYWWGYVLVYPIAGLVLARRGVHSGWYAAGWLCVAPFLYFLLLGIVDSQWLASDFALGGTIVAAAMTGVVASRVRRIRPGAA